MPKGHPDVDDVHAVFKTQCGSSAFDWSDAGFCVRLGADRFFTYTRTPEDLPS